MAPVGAVDVSPAMRVLQAPVNIAGQAFVTARALRSIGVRAEAWTYSTPFGYPTDRDLGAASTSRLVRLLTGGMDLARALPRFSHFHFHFGDSFWPWRLDLPIVRMRGKVVVEFWGSDVRNPLLAMANNPWLYPQMDQPSASSRLKVWGHCAHAAIVADHELLTYVAPYFDKVFIVRQRIWLDDFQPTYPDPQREPIVVAHAPSDRAIKGTEAILSALEEIRSHRPVQPLLVEGRCHRETIRLLSKADVVVDQLRIGTYGLLALEAMALGKPVVAYIRDDLRGQYPASLPVVSATPLTIRQVLERLLDDGTLRHELGVQGRRYVEEYHDARRIAQELFDIYRSL